MVLGMVLPRPSWKVGIRDAKGHGVPYFELQIQEFGEQTKVVVNRGPRYAGFLQKKLKVGQNKKIMRKGPYK